MLWTHNAGSSPAPSHNDKLKIKAMDAIKNITDTRLAITARLLEEQFTNGHRWIFKLSRPLRLGKHDITGEVFEVEKDNIEFKDKMPAAIKPYVPTTFYDIVVVSDAHTHAERLVFVGFQFENENREICYGRTGAQIHGEHTFLSHGGDAKTMRQPEVYLRRIAQINGFNWGGIIE